MGLGNIGLPVALYVHRIFPRTIGFDINQQAVKRASDKGVEVSTVPERADIYVVCVNTYYRNNVPDMTAIDSCCRHISTLNNEAIVCFESTLAVGTARKMALKYDLRYVAVCPHRWWEEDQENHGVKQLRVLGAYDSETLKKAEAFYNKLEIPVHLVSNLEIAEATKIAENAHRYVQIAFVEELKLIANKNGLDFEEWREAINTKWNVNLLEARDGIGKECLPKDTAFLTSLSPAAGLLTGAMQTNENYIQHFVKQKPMPNKQAPLMPLAKQHSP
jgi:UDP-N-acetyl-D-mannosaminuronic acid dehydrogenase